MKAEKLQIHDGIEAPCSDISFSWSVEGVLSVTMHFSLIIGGYHHDLEVIFSNPLAFKWEDESFGLIDCPPELPSCNNSQFKSFTYPAFLLEQSTWAEDYAMSLYPRSELKNHKVKHYALISLNDLVHVLSEDEPVIKIVTKDN